MSKKIDLTGRRFSRLTAIRVAGRDSTGRFEYLCRCDCGQEKTVRGSNLTSGHVKSCGCLLREADQGITHGLSHAPEYIVWLSMKRRCSNPKNESFKYYGGRGIKVCDRWLHSFENFLDDMGSRPSPEHSIDRINVDGDYEPSNCRWATLSEQARNKRTSNHREQPTPVPSSNCSEQNSQPRLASEEAFEQVPSNAGAVIGKPLTAAEHNAFPRGRWA